MAPGELTAIARRSARGWQDDGARSMGAALAFHSLLLLAPLMLVALALAATLAGDDETQLVLVQRVAALLGEDVAAGMEGLLGSMGEPRTAFLAGMSGAAAMVFGAGVVLGELRENFDRIWREPAAQDAESPWYLQVLAVALTIAAGTVLLVCLAASATLPRGAEFAASFVAIALLFALAYKLLPRAPVAWKDVWMGAAVASALFGVGKALAGAYFAHAQLGSAFGAAGAVLVVLFWLYYSAQVFFLGAELTRAANGSLTLI